MGPVRSIKVRGLRALGRVDVRLDGSSLVLIGPSGSGKSTLVSEIANELQAELSGKPHPAGDIAATGGTDRDMRMAFLTRPVQLSWETPPAAQAWRKSALFALRLDDERSGTIVRAGFDGTPKAPDERVAGQLASVLIDRWVQLRDATDPLQKKMHEAWIYDVQQTLRLLLGEPRLHLALAADMCALDLGDGRRPTFAELSRGHAAAVGLFSEIFLRVEAARIATGQPALDPTGLVVIDNIERDLDPRLQRELMTSLSSRYPRLQWIVATHSPLVALGLDDATVLDVARHELRRTATLRREGLETMVVRMLGLTPPTKKSAPPPPAVDMSALPKASPPRERSAPPPPPRRRSKKTKEGTPFGND